MWKKILIKNFSLVHSNKHQQLNLFSMFSTIHKKSHFRKSTINSLSRQSVQQSSQIQSNCNSIPQNIGVIGYGQMSGALIKGFLNSGVTQPDKLFVSERYQDRHDVLHEHGITNIVGDTLQDDKIEQMLKFSDILLVGVKPQNIYPVLDKISEKIQSRHLVISIAAGISLQDLQKHLGQKARVIRVMPNTPCLVGCGVSAYAPGKYATKQDKKIVQKLLSQVGFVLQIQQKHIHGIVGISGSAPAYIFMMIEAMADGGVKAGLSRQNSLRLAAKTVEGAAKMVLESSQNGLTHPGVLKDRVASPGGSTIAAIQKLEQLGIRNAFIQAVSAAEARSKEMEQESKKRMQ